PPLLVDVEVLVDEMAQEPSALRHAEAVRPLDGGPAVLQAQRVVRRVVVAEERDEVARGGEAEPLDDRPLGLADQLVEVAGPEAAGDAAADLRQGAGHALVDFGDRLPLQRPLATRDDDALVGLALPPGEHALRLAAGTRRVAAVALAAGQRQ